MDEAPKKSNPLKFVAIGCVVFALVMGCGFASCMLATGGAGIAAALSAPAEQTKSFLADLRARNYQGALSRMDPSYQTAHPLATFQQSVDAMPALTSSTDDTINNRNVTNGIATMSGTLTTPQGAVPVEVSLHSAGGTWNIDTVTVGGVPLQ